MNIAFFSECWDPQINGVVTSTKALAGALPPDRHTVHVFAPRYPGYQDEFDRIFRQWAVKYFFQPEFYFSSPLPYAALRKAREWRIDLVHLHSEFTLGMVASQVARRLGIPSVLTLHTLWEFYSHYFMWGLVPLSLFRYFLSMIYRLPDYFIAPSEKAERYLVDVMGVKKPIAIIPTGIKLDMFHQARLTAAERAARRAVYGLGPDDFVLMFAGRVGKEKALSVLMDGVAALLPAHPRLKLMIVGSGPYLEHYRRYARSRGLERAVVFTGYRPYEEMPLMYRMADAFAIASVSETQGLVTVEALASDLPVIVKNDPASLDIIDRGRHGLIFSTTREFSAAVERLIRDHDLRRRLGAEARAGSLRYGDEAYGRAVGDFYDWVVTDYRSTRRG
jgi:1,2-diacylglycerol 3-alpha-glucosyltransferase